MSKVNKDDLLDREYFRPRMHALFFKFEAELTQLLWDKMEVLTKSGVDPTEAELAVLKDGYFLDLVNLLVDKTAGTSEEQAAIKLRSYIHATEIQKIRLSAGHANRIYEDWMWYQIAALSCHQSLSSLGLANKMKQHLVAAENGVLELPPEEWLSSRENFIKNNLPEKVDFDHTKLVGREREKNNVLKKIRDRRIANIAIVAPGRYW